MNTVRLGSVPYLNSKVLIHGLEPEGTFADADAGIQNPKSEIQNRYTLTLDPPSLLAKKLAAGEVDVALVSSVEYFRRPGYTLVPGLSVSGRREMWSIRLFRRKPLERLKRVGLDPASETTNVFLQVLLKEARGLAPEYVALSRGEDPAARADLDGFLLIGDAALRFAEPGFEATDLLSLWDAATGLPFVFAAWLVRPEARLHGFPARLARARDEGLRHARAIAAAHRGPTGLDLERAHEYVTRIVRYELGTEEQAGLARFGQWLAKHGLVSAARALEFYKEPAAR
ncbi:MAG: menaquinone biosynthesis protein [Planctomycetes bacterium]|nr:menaquinone biosynthesis protein [Planctomycetota bacterium]